jgi:putative protein kinase ArgK-like GTPase of G3E family
MSDEDNFDSSLTARYANHCRVGQNLVEFILDFGQHYGEQAPVYHTRIITTAASVGGFVATILEAIEDHRKRLQAAGLEEPKE